MLRIRFFRTGRKKQPFYKIVVTDKNNPPSSGRFIDELGFYNPLTKECEIKKEKVAEWMGKGAQPSDVVRNLLIKKEIIEGEKVNVVSISRKRKAKIEEKRAKDEEVKETAEEKEKAEESSEEEKESSKEKTEEKEEVKKEEEGEGEEQKEKEEAVEGDVEDSGKAEEEEVKEADKQREDKRAEKEEEKKT